MAPTPSGNGYWIVSSEGGVYAFGDAQHYGGTNTSLPAGWFATSLTPTASGRGYWILANSGAVYTFGDAQYYGGANGAIPGTDLPAVSLQTTPTGSGYWIMSRAGGIYSFPTNAQPNPLPFYGAANTATELLSLIHISESTRPY